jgi:para-aminobenzoate synthetase / 4-amino-4-deoxychorismate lyase
MNPQDDICALLDDCDASPTRPSSRLYTGFVREHVCTDPAQLDATWSAVEADQRGGAHVLLMADYEWGTKLVGAVANDKRPSDETAALRVLVFECCDRLTLDQASNWLASQADADEPSGVMHLEPSVDRAEFTQAIERIHAYIAAGETYQINYTYRVHGQVFGSPLALYRRLRARQPVPYGAFIRLPPGAETTHVISCSPELFVRREGGLVTARPMKGTAARHTPPEGDSETARLLSLDTKNRAENLMIVDLLRNDLGRIAQIGSVRVPELFAVEPHSTLFQMTSTVQARLRPEIGFADVLRAVFPCGSITGAPKRHTMALIRELESTPRGLYCGAIGWADASAR